MLTLKNINKEDFENFTSKQENINYMQSISWGEFSKTIDHTTPYYLGLIDEKNNIIAATLLLQDYLKFNYTYFYAPYGFIINYENKELVKEMTKKIISFIKNKKAVFLKINPNILESNIIINYLKEIGYKYNNNNKIVYTINLDKEIEKLDYTEIIDLSIGTIKDLKELKYSDYYKTLYEIFNGNENTKANILIEKLNCNKTIKKLEENIKKINNQISILPIDNLSKLAKEKLSSLTKQKNTINEEIKKYKEYKSKYGLNIILSSQLMIIYNNSAWVIETKNNNNLPELPINNYIFQEHINYCKEHKIKIYNNNEKLINMKELNYIGEFNYIINKPLYILLKCKNKD